MARFKIQDLRAVETAPGSPTDLSAKLGEMIQSSTNVRAKVESADAETGQYRVVLQGTLTKEEIKRG
jgi:hypothetical protein